MLQTGMIYFYGEGHLDVLFKWLEINHI